MAIPLMNWPQKQKDPNLFWLNNARVSRTPQTPQPVQPQMAEVGQGAMASAPQIPMVQPKQKDNLGNYITKTDLKGIIANKPEWVSK